MITGSCPYCDAGVINYMPESTPCFGKSICEECNEQYWMYYSRIDPVALTREGFEINWIVDEELKTITPTREYQDAIDQSKKFWDSEVGKYLNQKIVDDIANEILSGTSFTDNGFSGKGKYQLREKKMLQNQTLSNYTIGNAPKGNMFFSFDRNIADKTEPAQKKTDNSILSLDHKTQNTEGSTKNANLDDRYDVDITLVKETGRDLTEQNINSEIKKSTVDGTIMIIEADTVNVELYTQNSVLEANFPKALFQENIFIGMPFSLSMAEIDGIRTPVILQRELSAIEKNRKKDLSSLINRLSE